MKAIKRSFFVTFIIIASSCFLHASKEDPIALYNQKIQELEKQGFSCDLSNNLEILFAQSKELALACTLAEKDENKTEEAIKKSFEREFKKDVDSFLTFSKTKNNIFFHAIKNDKNNIIACALFFVSPNQKRACLYFLEIHPTCNNNELIKEVLILSIFKQVSTIKKNILFVQKKKQEELVFYENLGANKKWEEEEQITFELAYKQPDARTNAFNVSERSVAQNVARALRRKKRKITREKLTLDTSSNFDNLSDVQEIFVEAFLPRGFACARKNESKQDIREELVEHWKKRYKKIVKLAQEKKAFYHVVRNKENKVVAFAIFFLAEKSDTMYLSLLAVHPKGQGLGLGALMIFSIFDKHSDVQNIFLGTGRENNEKAIGFYEYLGCQRYIEMNEGIMFKLRKRDL